MLKGIVERDLGDRPKIRLCYFYVNDKLDFLRRESRRHPVVRRYAASRLQKLGYPRDLIWRREDMNGLCFRVRCPEVIQ